MREQEDYLGPHLIIAPLSTLSNWINEFQKWAPSIPVLMYHGTIKEREQLHKAELLRNLQGGRPTTKFPVVCTSYEMVINDSHLLSKINWEFIIIVCSPFPHSGQLTLLIALQDEGHRMKNAESRLFQEVCKFTSASRFLITGTPLQNNLKELWSLLHFLMPNIFTDWEAFETWFDFSDLQDEEGTERFVEDKANHDLVKKIHNVLQPLLLRRVKADVLAWLPKKREYVLYAPMTKEQTDLYNILSDKNVDTRAYLEKKLIDKLTGTTNTPAGSRKVSPRSSRSTSVNVKNEKGTNGSTASKTASPAGSANAFDTMMSSFRRKPGRPAKKGAANRKRKEPPTSERSTPKTAKSAGTSTPTRATRELARKNVQRYKLDESEDDDLSDDEFEEKIADHYIREDTETSNTFQTPEEIERAATLELAKKQIAKKKLDNVIMQLRQVCNSPLNFYDPFPNGEGLDETIITSSGKMLLLDRLLPVLFERGHKVLIFSQFTTQLDILTDYCEYRKYNACRIDGAVGQKDRAQQIELFNQDPDFKIFLLSTRAGGQGINLASADTVILFDSDWNPQQDLQAQDRCHRIGQTRPVIVYRLATKDTVEESLLMSADAKRRLEKLVIRKGTYKTLRQKTETHEDLDQETLRHLLLKDGEVYKFSGGNNILSEEDLEVLCDRYVLVASL